DHALIAPNRIDFSNWGGLRAAFFFSEVTDVVLFAEEKGYFTALCESIGASMVRDHNQLSLARRRGPNRRRWPMHRLFCEAVSRCGAREMLSLGRRVTGIRNVLASRAQNQIAGA